MKNNEVNKNIFENLLIAVCIMIYFIVINFTYYRLPMSNLLLVLKVLSMVILAIGIVLLEIAYRTDSGKRALNAIESLFLAAHTLSISHIVELQKINFANYILVSSYTFSVYYLLKTIFIYTRDKRKYLQSFSDIKEIITNDPVKKVATKKNEKK